MNESETKCGAVIDEYTKECEMAATMTVATGSVKDQGETTEANTLNQLQEQQIVPLESLSEMTGFPVDFIKKELLLNEDELSMENLRKSMASYLENTIQELS